MQKGVYVPGYGVKHILHYSFVLVFYECIQFTIPWAQGMESIPSGRGYIPSYPGTYPGMEHPSNPLSLSTSLAARCALPTTSTAHRTLHHPDSKKTTPGGSVFTVHGYSLILILAYITCPTIPPAPPSQRARQRASRLPPCLQIINNTCTWHLVEGYLKSRAATVG